MLFRRSKWLLLFFLLFAAPLFFAYCAGSPVPRIGVQVSPLCVVLQPGGSQPFNATIFVDEVNQGVDNSAVDWSVFGGDVNGIISSAGLYLAPNTNPPPASQVQIIATSVEDDQKQGQATVILTPTPIPSPNPCAAPPFI